LFEEKIYEEVLRELDSGIRRGGLWLKAIESARGDENQVKSWYIKLRVQSIKDELEMDAKHRREQLQERSRVDDGAWCNAVILRDKNGYTKLMSAVLEADIDKVRLLLASGASPRVMGGPKNNETALDLANRECLMATDPNQIRAYEIITEELDLADKALKRDGGS